MQDFLWAVAAKLRRLFPPASGGAGLPVYFGRLLQGEKRPCFYLPPPKLSRQLWPCGRVRREIDLELHYYAGADGFTEQQRVGEGLARGLLELTGKLRGYRGHDLRWQAGNDCLRFYGRYVYYTTRELEAAGGWSEWPEAAELMQYFTFKENNLK